MLIFRVRKRELFRLVVQCMPAILVAIILCSAIPCFGASSERSKPFPLIIMGGHWAANQKPEESDLSRVCGGGFTHVFSYSTSYPLKTKVNLTGAIKTAVELSELIKRNCPDLGLVMGIPGQWIYEERLDWIESYISSLKASNVSVDYWLSDEMIFSMVSEGLKLQEAERRARKTLDAVAKVSNAPYIWIEPGNYNQRLSSILDVLGELPAGIKSYDEYVISRSGRLSKSLKGFNSVINTLRRLKVKGNKVFPVCEIGQRQKKDAAPLEEELAAISISLLMDGADGLIFWEERWTTPEILKSLKKISNLTNFLKDIGISKFTRTKDAFSSWEAEVNKKTIKVVLNTTESNIDLNGILPERAVVVWPLGEKINELKPIDLLVYEQE